jgi:hypothetical protein
MTKLQKTLALRAGLFGLWLLGILFWSLAIGILNLELMLRIWLIP